MKQSDILYVVTDGTWDYSSHTNGVDAQRQLEIFKNPALEIKVVEKEYRLRPKPE